MNKFTIFTVILTVVVVVAISDILVNDYLPDLAEETETGFQLPGGIDLSQTLQTNVLGSDVIAEDNNDNVVETVPVVKLPETSGTANDFESATSGTTIVAGGATTTGAVTDFEVAGSSTVANKSVSIRADHLRPAGYLDAYLAPESFDGNVFRTISLGDLPDVTVEQAVIRTESELLTRVYVVKAGFNAEIQDVYDVMKVRAQSDVNVEVNETNEYGSSSFYMNDKARANTAFLTARIGRAIYSFSYPKTYHPQVKNLVQLLMWEFAS